ncbi:TlpA disulfide reductase family protein [Sphingomonas oligophenolica]|uniref:TlpA disulfide reductase family protein n=1 Tax=Sphingomonas oligophenolica TaxID=301154 RepID=A0ABU9Y2V5_9SPHN
MSFRSTIVPLLMLGLLAGCDRQVSTQEQANANKLPVEGTGTPAGEAPKTGDKVIVDAIGTIDRSHKGTAAPAISFQDPAGRPTSIAAFKGRPVLLNLWATWCAPCVTEMPTLNAAASNMTVVTVSQDLGDDARAKVTSFLARGGYTKLQANLDPKADLSVAYNASLPTSILYDSAGREVWRMTGGMDWTTGTAKALLAEAR